MLSQESPISFIWGPFAVFNYYMFIILETDRDRSVSSFFIHFLKRSNLGKEQKYQVFYNNQNVRTF